MDQVPRGVAAAVRNELSEQPARWLEHAVVVAAQVLRVGPPRPTAVLVAVASAVGRDEAEQHASALGVVVAGA